MVINGAHHPALFPHNHPEGLTKYDWMEIETKTDFPPRNQEYPEGPCAEKKLEGKQSTHGKGGAAAQDSLIYQLLRCGPVLFHHAPRWHNTLIFKGMGNAMAAPWHSDHVHSNPI